MLWKKEIVIFDVRGTLTNLINIHHSVPLTISAESVLIVISVVTDFNCADSEFLVNGTFTLRLHLFHGNKMRWQKTII